METINNELFIKPVTENKKRFLPLLLVGDESEEMINRYIGRGILYVGFVDSDAVSVCVTTEVDSETVEIKNLAVESRYRKQGIGRRMIEYVERLHPGKTLILGTGETPSTLRFYKSCGFVFSHIIPDFFIRNYPEPIIEEGIRLKDMIYLTKAAEK